jgi:alpha/beta hydrolase fold
MLMSTADALTRLVSDGQTELREGYADVGDVKLHYVEAGDGPLVVLLHGFPEFWYGWRLQIAPLAAAGFRVVAPDLRGYNLSSKPDGVAAYGVDKLADDIRGLIQERGAESALVAGWPSSTRPIRASSMRDCATPASCDGPGTSSTSSSRICPSTTRRPTTGSSCRTFCATRSPRTRPRR